MNPPRDLTDYQVRLSRVIAYIHDHLSEPLDLDRLAEVANLSPYHWHRIYHALQGETLAATVIRLRLQRGSGYLAHTTWTVADIARRCGYQNVQSFTRAFRQVYGTSPRAWRENTSRTPFEAVTPVSTADTWPVDVREVPQITLAGLDHRGSYMRVGQAFEASRIHMAAQGLMSSDTRWLAVYFDDPFAVPESQLHSRAGLSLAPDAVATAPLITFSLGGGPCAVLRFRGPYASMRAAYHWLYGTWLVDSGYSPADHPVFEEYLNSPRDTAPADLLTDIFLPLAAGKD